MKKLGIISVVLLIIGCMGIITVKNCLISLPVRAASHLITDTIPPEMDVCYVEIYGCAKEDDAVAEVIQRFDSTATPENDYSLMEEKLHEHIHDVYGTMLKWTVDIGYGMYAHYALIDLDADAEWDFAFKAISRETEQNFLYVAKKRPETTGLDVESEVEKITEESGTAEASEDPENIIQDEEYRMKGLDEEDGIAYIVGIATIGDVDIFLASKAEFDHTPIYSTEDARHLIEASLDAVLVDKAEQCPAFFYLF